jgi:hypothetical protein
MSITPYGLIFLKGMLLTQAVEVPIAWVLLSMLTRRSGIPRSSLRIVAATIIGNLATLPWLWFVYPEFMTYGYTIVLGEITAVGLEALLYHLIIGIGYKYSLLVSVAANAASVLIGLLIMPPWR